MSLAHNIRTRRTVLKLSQKDLARRAGVSQQLIHALEAGTTRSSRFIGRISEALDCPVDDLAPVQEKSAARAADAPGDAERSSSLPIFASAAASAAGEAAEHLAIDLIPRPFPLRHVRKAYGVLVTDTAMAPEFEPGDYIFINPHMPPLPQTSCLFYRPGQGEMDARTARLLDAGPETWEVCLWSAADGAPQQLPRATWSICHRIVGRYCRK